MKLNDDCNYLPYVLGRLFSYWRTSSSRPTRHQHHHQGPVLLLSQRYTGGRISVLLNLAEKHQKAQCRPEGLQFQAAPGPDGLHSGEVIPLI